MRSDSTRPADFRGGRALQALREAGGAAAVARRVVSLVVDAPHTNLWGGELVLRNNAPVGFVTSAAFGHTVGKPVALGIVSNAHGPADKAWIESGSYTIDLAGERYSAQVGLKAPLDSTATRA